MKCKVCGAINEDYLEYCENCAAPLKESQAAADAPTSGGAREQRSWDFVASPDWSKPEFSANTVSETDIPEGFTPQSFRSRFSAEPAQQPASAPASGAPAAAQASNSVRRTATQAQQAKRNSQHHCIDAVEYCLDQSLAVTEGQIKTFFKMFIADSFQQQKRAQHHKYHGRHHPSALQHPCVHDKL